MKYFIIHFRTYVGSCFGGCHHHERLGLMAKDERVALVEFYKLVPERDVHGIPSVEEATDWLQPDTNVPAGIRMFEAWQKSVNEDAANKARLLLSVGRRVSTGCPVGQA